MDPADIGIQCYFDLVIDNSGTSILTEGVSSDTCKVYTYISGTNELIEVTTFETMDDSAKYIIKFIKTGEQASVSLSSTLTLVE